MSIGRLARVSRLSIKALRIYDRDGLLPPAYVDPDSGYRYYDRSQIKTAAAIALLRSLDLPLADIRALLALDAPDALRDALELQRARSERDIERCRRSLRALDRILAAGELLPYEVELADDPHRRLVALSRTVPTERLTEGVADLAAELEHRVSRAGLSGGDEAIALYPLDPREPCPVVLGVPCDEGLERPTAPLQAVSVPAARVVTTVHVGAHDELPLAYAAVMAHAHEAGLQLAGEVRETYLNDPCEVPAEELVTRVAVPLGPPGG